MRRSREEFLECVLFTATSVLEAVEFFREQLLPFRPPLPFGRAVFTASRYVVFESFFILNILKWNVLVIFGDKPANFGLV